MSMHVMNEGFGDRSRVASTERFDVFRTPSFEEPFVLCLDVHPGHFMD